MSFAIRMKVTNFTNKIKKIKFVLLMFSHIIRFFMDILLRGEDFR